MPDPISWSYALPYFSLSFLGGYLLGSIPISFLLVRLGGRGDLREEGSKNVGATNALRIGGTTIGALALLGDVGKGFLASFLGAMWGPDMAVLAVAGAFFGHLFPVWLKFRGGKGVAVYFGATLALYAPLAGLFAAVWLLSALLFRYSSVSSLLAALAVPAAAIFWNEWQTAELTFFLALWIWAKHAGNLKRLYEGKESKISFTTKKE